MTESRQPVIVLTAPGEDAPAGIEAVKARAEVRFAWDEQTLRDTLPGTDVMMVTDFRTEALEAAWPAADRLQWIHATSAGVDALMFPALIKSDVIVTNARAFSTAPCRICVVQHSDVRQGLSRSTAFKTSTSGSTGIPSGQKASRCWWWARAPSAGRSAGW